MEILLFKGPALVGQAKFPGSTIPNNVVTFLGVWSDRPFDRVVINDTSGNDDDDISAGSSRARCRSDAPSPSTCRMRPAR